MIIDSVHMVVIDISPVFILLQYIDPSNYWFFFLSFAICFLYYPEKVITIRSSLFKSTVVFVFVGGVVENYTNRLRYRVFNIKILIL